MRILVLAAVLAVAGCVGGAPPDGAGEAVSHAARSTTSLTDGVWLKGDLHVHSRHSRDSSNNPVAKIVAFAEEVGMDYLAITDHDNHVEGNVARHTWADPELVSDAVLLLYGAEWTTHRGHGNPFSPEPYDHRRFYDVRDARDATIGAVKEELGLHLSANHPGGGDNFGFSYDIVDSIEVWNSARWSRNADAIAIWDDMLKSGRMLTGRGGSDSHHGYPDAPEQAADLSWQAPLNNVGTPTTWVFATENSAVAVIDALSKGRVSVSANPYSPRIELIADLNRDGEADMMMGDNTMSIGDTVSFRVELAGNTVPDAAYMVRVVKDGAPFASFEVTQTEQGIPPAVEFTDAPAADTRTYYRVEVEGPVTSYPEVPESMALSAPMVGLSNPIYFNFDLDF